MYNNAIVGFIPFVDGDGVQHAMEIRLGVNLEDSEYTLTIALDGELITDLEMTETSGVYTIKKGGAE